jgi:hypothetical protein
MNDIRAALRELRLLRSGIEQRMLSLPDSFNGMVRYGRLRLRPYRRTKDGPPYAVYWILMSRHPIHALTGVRRKPRYPFRRVKVSSRQDLDDAIYHGAISACRETVYRMHARVTALNESHAAISGALEDIRRLLQGFCRERFTDPDQRAEACLSAFEDALDDAMSELQAVDTEMRIFPGGLPLRLVYERDAAHPYGRLRWRWVRDGRPESPLTDRRKRELRLPRELRLLFTPYERRRRRATAQLIRLTRIARRLKTQVLPVPAKVQTLLASEGMSVSWRTPA